MSRVPIFEQPGRRDRDSELLLRVKAYAVGQSRLTISKRQQFLFCARPTSQTFNESRFDESFQVTPAVDCSRQ